MPGEKHNFIDCVRVYLKAGNGGDGCLSFRREKFVPFGGPDGGNGGKGGDIYCEADSDLNTLLEVAYHPHWKAEDGGHGKGKNLYGRAGKDAVVYVPCGTVIRRGHKVIADMTDNGQRLLLAKGGRGGRGNLSFKSHSNTAPKIAEKGEPGEKFELEFELRVLADVGLLGFPNAGKSTLLSRISSARPKIADYPFTTLHPSLGMVYHKKNSFVAADIPGLIEGAHEGRGLGYSFLRHMARTRLLIQLVDPSGFDGTGPSDSVNVIYNELKKFSPELATKPRIIAVNKSDLPEAEAVFKKIRKAFRKQTVFLISAATGSGVSSLLDEAVRVLSRLPAARPLPAAAENIIERRLEPAFSISRGRDGVLEITGPSLQRMVSMTNFSQYQAVERIKNVLKRMGVDKALKRRGVAEGDTVRLAGMEFEWTQDVYTGPERSVSRRKR